MPLKRRPRAVSGVFLESPWRGILRAQSFPKYRRKWRSVYEKALQDRFKKLVAASKRVSAREQNTLRDALERHAATHRGQQGVANIRQRDLLVQLLSGRLFAFRRPDGKIIWPAAAVQEMSDAMDWAEPRTGSLLVRGPDRWKPTMNCKAGSLLMLGPDFPLRDCCPRSDYYYMTPEPPPTFPEPVPVGFDVMALNWKHLWWTEGDAFQAAEPNDGARFSPWPDEVGTLDATNAASGSRPVYHQADARFNNRPSSDSNSDGWLRTAAATTIERPLTIVIIGQADQEVWGGNGFYIDGIPTKERCIVTENKSGNHAGMYAGQWLTGGAYSAAAHLYVAYFNGNQSTLERDGSLLATGDPGTDRFQGASLHVGQGSTNPRPNRIVLAGVIDGALSASEKQDLLTWAQEEYGTP